MRIILYITTIVFAKLYFHQIEETRKKEIEYNSLYKNYLVLSTEFLGKGLHKNCFTIGK